MKQKIALEIICWLLVFLFMYAAVSKLADVEKFGVQIGQSPMLTAFAGWVVWIVPAVEVMVCMMLSIEKFRMKGLFASFGLMVMFTAYILAITQFSEYIPCSCGGVLSTLGWTEHLIFNCAFIIISVVGIFLQGAVEAKAEAEIFFGKYKKIQQ